MDRLLTGKKRIRVLALPTGIGKSLVGMTHAIFGGKRTGYLTSTKGLQDQVLRDFRESGLVDIRGMANYPCRLLEEYGDRGHCAEGPCLDGEKCRYRDRGCSYFDAMTAAKASDLLVTNYAKWMTARHSEEGGLGSFEMLVCDEAHELPAEVSGWLRIELREAEMKLPSPFVEVEGWYDIRAWRFWAGPQVEMVGRLLEKHAKGKRARELRDLQERLTRLRDCSDDWIPEPTKNGWSFEPLWPTSYAGPALWEGIEQIVLASATIRPKTLEQLGIKKDEYEWIECPSPFPIGRRPIHLVPSVRLSHRTDEGSLGIWLDRIDQIIERRLDRKGIIHTVSYDRAKFLLKHSRWRSIMMGHETSSTRGVVQDFKESESPRVLVSPSLHTGWDFPAELARYQIVAKVPWPDTRSRLMQARTAADPDYPAYEAITKVVQMAGRVVRGPEDWGETFIVDDNWKWMAGKYRAYLPSWFREAYRVLEMVPAAPRPIGLAA